MTYHHSSKIGDQGVDAVASVLSEFGTTIKMQGEGCPIIEQIQLMGGDLLFVPDGTETIHFIEVKTATKTYQSAFIETVSNVRTGRPGWIFKLRCGYVWYLYLDSMTSYLMDAPALQRYIYDNEQFYREIPNKMNDSRGIVVPWAILSCELSDNEIVFIDHKLSDFESKLDQVGLLN